MHAALCTSKYFTQLWYATQNFTATVPQTTCFVTTWWANHHGNNCRLYFFSIYVWHPWFLPLLPFFIVLWWSLRSCGLLGAINYYIWRWSIYSLPWSNLTLKLVNLHLTAIDRDLYLTKYSVRINTTPHVWKWLESCGRCLKTGCIIPKRYPWRFTGYDMM